MTVTDTWLADGAVLAAVHLPDDGRAAAGVVLCPPIGQEYVTSYRTLRLLAEKLTAHGLGAIRFDYPGYGDSAVEANDDSLVTGALLAATTLRAAGCGRIAYVGLASGALIASAAAVADPDAGGLVLWDPPASGRQWLRRARSLYSMTVDNTPITASRSMTIVGADLTSSTAARLAAIEYDRSTPSRMPVLVAVRGGDAGLIPAAFRATASDEAAAEFMAVDDHESMLDTSSITSRIPGSSVESVAGWCARTLPSTTPDAVAVAAVATARFSVTDPRAADGRVEIEELIVRIGPHRLFGIETRPASATGTAPGIVLHNGSAEHRIGAARYQVGLARELAARGIRVLRIDRRGTGESGPVSAGEHNMLFTQEWVDDGDQALRYLDLPRERTGVAGMCVGAWIGLKSDPSLVRFVVAISPNDYRLAPAAPGMIAASADRGGSTQRARLTGWFKRRLPYAAMVALAMGGRAQLVEPLLRRPLEAGTDTTLVMGPLDRSIFDERGGAIAVDRLRATTGILRIVQRETGDHSLFAPEMRSAAVREVIRAAETAFAPFLRTDAPTHAVPEPIR